MKYWAGKLLQCASENALTRYKNKFSIFFAFTIDICVADIGEIQKLTAQAAGIGNNLNQIARYFHGGGLASRGMLEELKKCIAEIRELRQEIVQLGGVYRGNSKTHRK